MDWQFEKVDTREDVATKMPDTFKVEVYKIKSGDSGKTYYVQYISQHGKGRNEKDVVGFYLCNCPEGTFRAPLGIVSAVQCACKHSEYLHHALTKGKTK